LKEIPRLVADSFVIGRYVPARNINSEPRPDCPFPCEFSSTIRPTNAPAKEARGFGMLKMVSPLNDFHYDWSKLCKSSCAI
jgi:hypothetical protein